jgi:large subunit ribosomal protein L5
MVENKAIPPLEKKAEATKKVEKAVVPDAKSKVVTEKKDVKAKKPVVPAKPMAEKKVEDKVASNENASKSAVAPAKQKPVVETKGFSVKKEPVAEMKVTPEVTKPLTKEWTGNPMLKPIIEKVTVNMSVGKSGTPLEQAVTIIKKLTNQNPSKRKAKKTIREFGIRKGESIACLVTLRDEKAEEFLKKALYAVENKLSKYCFDRQGNFSFGIKEHIDIPGTKYVPELGIHGMDVSVSLGRAGYRVKRRHRASHKIGKDHLLTAKEAILFIKDEFDVEIL